MAGLLRHSYFKLLGLNRSVASSFVGFRRISEDYRPDYYSALGLSRAADTKQIKLAYFRMAKKYHPVSQYSLSYVCGSFSTIVVNTLKLVWWSYRRLLSLEAC